MNGSQRNEDTPLADDVAAGQAIYTPTSLRFYDLIVLGISNRFIWRCRTRHLVEFYQRHLSSNHLDVGVGSGYFMDRCRFPCENPRLGLLDLNQSALDYAGRRVERFSPELYHANVLEPLHLDCRKFQSIGLGYLLHCLPGCLTSECTTSSNERSGNSLADTSDKGKAFKYLSDVLLPDGCLFGATLLAEGVARNWAAKRLMQAYQRKGIFWNAHDSLEGLRHSLERVFGTVQIDTRGCAALFHAKNPRG